MLVAGRTYATYPMRKNIKRLGEVMLEVKSVSLDGEQIHKLKCPGCGEWAEIDENQLHGRVSCICDECGWHGMVEGVDLNVRIDE